MTLFVLRQVAFKLFLFFVVLVVVQYFVLPSVSTEISAEIDKITETLWKGIP